MPVKNLKKLYQDKHAGFELQKIVVDEEGNFSVVIGAQLYKVTKSGYELFTELQFVADGLYIDNGRVIAKQSGRSIVIKQNTQELANGLVFGDEFLVRETPFGVPDQIAQLEAKQVAFCAAGQLVVSSPYFETSKSSCSWQLSSYNAALTQKGCYYIVNNELVLFEYESDFVAGGVFREMRPTYRSGVKDVTEVQASGEWILVRRVSKQGDLVSVLKSGVLTPLFLVDRGVPVVVPAEREVESVPACVMPSLDTSTLASTAQSLDDLKTFLTGERVSFLDKTETKEFDLVKISQATEALDKENEDLKAQIRAKIAKKLSQAPQATSLQEKTALELLKWLGLLAEISPEDQNFGIQVGALERAVQGLEEARGRVYIEK